MSGMAKNMMHRLFEIRYILLAGLMGIIFFIFVGFAEKSTRSMECRGIHISFHPEGKNKFLSESEVISILENTAGGVVTGKRFSDLKLNELEASLDKNNFVRKAEVYTRLDDSLYIDIYYRNPVLRIMSILHDDYYIDEYGEPMPLSPNHTARILVATGYITGNNDSVTLKALYDIAMIITRDSFLKSLVGQIYVAQDKDMTKEFIIIPRIGRLNFILGDGEEPEKKFSKIKIYFSKVYPYIDQDNYESVNFNYKDQIILKKKING